MAPTKSQTIYRQYALTNFPCTCPAAEARSHCGIDRCFLCWKTSAELRSLERDAPRDFDVATHYEIPAFSPPNSSLCNKYPIIQIAGK